MKIHKCLHWGGSNFPENLPENLLTAEEPLSDWRQMCCRLMAGLTVLCCTAATPESKRAVTASTRLPAGLSGRGFQHQFYDEIWLSWWTTSSLWTEIVHTSVRIQQSVDISNNYNRSHDSSVIYDKTFNFTSHERYFSSQIFKRGMMQDLYKRYNLLITLSEHMLSFIILFQFFMTW